MRDSHLFTPKSRSSPAADAGVLPPHKLPARKAPYLSYQNRYRLCQVTDGNPLLHLLVSYCYVDVTYWTPSFDSAFL